MPKTSTVGEVLADLGITYQDQRPVTSLTKDNINAVLKKLQSMHDPVDPSALGCIGDSLEGFTGYAIERDTHVIQSGACIPYVVEVWARCERIQGKASGELRIEVALNKSHTLAKIRGHADPQGLMFKGCDLDREVRGKRADYELLISVIAPFVQLTTDGKNPSLSMFGRAIAEAVRKAAAQAYNTLERPPDQETIKSIAYSVMKKAYMKASGNGELPARARQVMYAARPEILRMTGKESLDDKYFTQTLLPDYQNDNPQETADWNVVYDARGSFHEPHTGVEIPLGTLEVREYLERQLTPDNGPSLSSYTMYPTCRAEHRFTKALFIEKEGFDPLLEAAQISDRFDIATLSNKGLSVTATRLLLDCLVSEGYFEEVFVLSDFDITAFSIKGTLGTDSRRYTFENTVPIIDIGLRLEDIQDLESEPVDLTDEEQAARAATLERHGATEEEIQFLIYNKRRVELNALTAPQFIEFIERKLTEHGVTKIIPDQETLEAHARRVTQQIRAEKALAPLLEKMRAECDGLSFPDLANEVQKFLKRSPDISWDMAVSEIIRSKDLT
jgi:hypothetical protein